MLLRDYYLLKAAARGLEPGMLFADTAVLGNFRAQF
jgi:hypothetical protein